VFPGNPQGRHIRETGEKGVTLIDVKQGRIHGKPRHHTLDVVRWALIEADVSAAPDLDAALATIRGAIASALAVSAPRLLAARVRIGGATQAHAALFAAHDLRERIMGEAIAAGGDEIFWLEKLALNTTPATERVAATPLEILLHERLAAPPSDAVLQDVRKWARDVLEKYPPLKAALSDSIDAHPALALTQDVPQGAELDAIIEEARALVFARLGA
jgi:hypothetical protein